MVVMHVTSDLAPGGAEKAAVLMANWSANHLIDGSVKFCLLRKEEDFLSHLLNEKVKLLRLFREGRFDFSAVFRFRKLVRENNVAIIHSHNTAVFFVVLATLGLNVKRVWHDNYGGTNTSLSSRIRPLFRWFLERLDWVFAVNSELKEWSSSLTDGDKVSYVPNFSVRTSSDLNVNESLALPGERMFRIAHLAHFRPQKDHLNLINAFEVVYKEFGPKVHLLLIGQYDENSSYYKDVEELIESKLLNDNVHILGVMPHPEIVLDNCHIGVLSSRSEGLPLALIEYGLSGLAPVVTDVGQCSEVLDNGRVGRLVQALDSDQLAQGIIGLLRDKDEALALGETFSSYIKDNYSAQIVMDRIHSVYQKLK